MAKYKVTRWMQASVPVVSYVEANSSEEAEEESSTAPYNYDYGNSVIGDIEDTEVEVTLEETSNDSVEETESDDQFKKALDRYKYHNRFKDKSYEFYQKEIR